MASARNMAFIVSIAVSACLTAWAGGSPAHAWVAWLSLLPLFFAIRLLRPLWASACGAIWGASLFAFCVACGWPTPIEVENPGFALSRGPGFAPFVLMTSIPAVYLFLGAWLTRWIGFSPFVLGVGWMGVELALAPLGMHNGLLAGTQNETVLLDFIGRALGYVLVGFVVAYVNATLVVVLGRVYLSVPRYVPTIASANSCQFLVAQTFGRLSAFAIQPSQPRAPPF